MKFTPASAAACSAAIDCVSSTVAQAPKLTVETSMSVVPSRRYCMLRRSSSRVGQEHAQRALVGLDLHVGGLDGADGGVGQPVAALVAEERAAGRVGERHPALRGQ